MQRSGLARSAGSASRSCCCYETLQLKKIAGGRSGSVFRVFDEDAVPMGLVIKLYDGKKDDWYPEYDMLNELRHRNIIRCQGEPIKIKNRHFLVLEMMEKGSLQDMLDTLGILSEEKIKWYIRQLLSGVEYIHGREIVHKDIRAANCLVDEDDILKLADFADSEKLIGRQATKGVFRPDQPVAPEISSFFFEIISEPLPQTSMSSPSHVIQDFWEAPKALPNISYPLPPHVIQDIWDASKALPRHFLPASRRGDVYGKPADIYSVGYILYQLFGGSIKRGETQAHRELEFAPAVPEKARELIRKCMEEDPSLRPTATQLRQDKYWYDAWDEENCVSGSPGVIVFESSPSPSFIGQADAGPPVIVQAGSAPTHGKHSDFCCINRARKWRNSELGPGQELASRDELSSVADIFGRKQPRRRGCTSQCMFLKLPTSDCPDQEENLVNGLRSLKF